MLAKCSCLSTGEFGDLIDCPDTLGFDSHQQEQFDPQTLRRQNDDLTAKLRLLLPPLPVAALNQDTGGELGASLSTLPVATQEALACGWVPYELRACSSTGAEALCRLRPVPRSLLMQVQRLSCEVTRFERPAATPGELRHLRQDYLVLKVLQRIVALHTMKHSVDGPSSGQRVIDAVRNRHLGNSRADRQLARDTDNIFTSTLILQSTYPAEVLDAARIHLQEAVAAVLPDPGKRAAKAC